MGSSINLADIAVKLTPEDADFHRRHVADILNRPNIKFPGAQPVSFARKHLLELQHDDYFLCEKTDGARCLLFLTQTINHNQEPVETQFVIDRKNDYYFIELDYIHMPPATPEGYNLHDYQRQTILDGELVRQRYPDGHEQLTYLIFDCLAVQGDNIMNRDYSVRIGKVQSLVLKPYKLFAKDFPKALKEQPFQIKMKDWQLPYGTEMMFRDVIPKLPHGNDGLIFTCKNTPYVAGTDKHILKWKPPHENTVDFRLQIVGFPVIKDEFGGSSEDWDARPEIDLLVFHGNKDYRKFATLSLTDEEWTAIKGMEQQIDWRIIECYRDASSGRWRPKIESDGTPRFRDDKEHANHISVVESVIESIEDAVSEQDLIAIAGKVRTAYKKREADAAEQKRRRQAPPPQQQPPRRPPQEVAGPSYED